MKIEVSSGEIFDKLSILEVKNDKLADADKLSYVMREHEYLQTIAKQINFSLQDEVYILLREINYKLWDIEDEIRLKEEQSDFGSRFIELSRLIYKLNDERFRLKNIINIQTNSNFKEQKGHKTV
tara:strand:- start:256 stop:630 length:375 start_codon:yes stop_codon:yes gene_type:complete